MLDGFESAYGWVIGGSVVTCLQPPSASAPAPRGAGRDIDIAFVGLSPWGVAAELLRLDAFVRRTQAAVLAVRTAHTVTWVLPYPLPRIQAVLGSWDTPQDVLHYADVDCCAVAMALKPDRRVVASLRGLHAWTFRVNVPTRFAHGIRGSIQYEQRLWKYAIREGFAVVHHDVGVDDPAVQRLRDNAVVSALRMQSTHGLAWLYLVEAGTFRPSEPPCALEASPERGLAEIRSSVEAAGYAASDGYGQHEAGYLVMPTPSAAEVAAVNHIVRGDEFSRRLRGCESCSGLYIVEAPRDLFSPEDHPCATAILELSLPDERDVETADWCVF